MITLDLSKEMHYMSFIKRKRNEMRIQIERESIVKIQTLLEEYRNIVDNVLYHNYSSENFKKKLNQLDDAITDLAMAVEG
jgi:hypothetical protein